jgi:hypothetical protein
MRIDNPRILKIANLTTDGFVKTQSGDGSLYIDTSGGGSGVAPYSTTFDATTSWGVASGGFYSIAITHNLNTPNIVPAFFDSTGEMVFPSTTIKTSDNILTISVTDVPDNRFAGRAVIMTGAAAVAVREILAAARTYYVRADGNDANTGLANTSGGAFLTIQRAVDVYQALDCNGFAVTISVADGTYAAGATITGRIGTGTLTITGNTGTPDNVYINATTIPFNLSGHPSGSSIYIRGFKLATTAAVSILAELGAVAWIKNINFGATAAFHLYTNSFGKIFIEGSYTISAGGAAHWVVISQGQLQGDSAATVTVSGTPAFSLAFVYIRAVSYILTNSAITWSGSATGKRYQIESNAVLDTQGSGANFFPGNAAGTTATGGQYL